MFFSGPPSAITYLYGYVMAEIYISEYSGFMKNSFSLLFSLFTMSGYTNRANKNSGYNNISYNNDNAAITISWYTENPDIVRTVCFGILRHIQGHSAIFNHGQAYWGILRHIKVYSGIIEVYGVIIRHSRNSAYRCIYQRLIFRTLTYLEPEASLKYCWTCKMIMNIQSPSIVKTVYLSISRYI